MLFKALYLRNRMSDRQAVFFDEYHLDVKVVWHGYHIASVPVMARGACQTWGILDDPQTTYSFHFVNIFIGHCHSTCVSAFGKV